jgi:hypothetical protein
MINENYFLIEKKIENELLIENMVILPIFYLNGYFKRNKPYEINF